MELHYPHTATLLSISHSDENII